MLSNLKKIKKPILITGASGFIGSNLLRFFYKKNINVYGIVRKNSDDWRIRDFVDKKKIFYVNLENKSKLNKIISKIKPKTIYHLATYGGSSLQSEEKKIKNCILNGTMNLLNSCKKNNFDIFVNTGSSSEYGFVNKPMKENDPINPNSCYSLYKGITTIHCKYISFKENLPIVTVRPFHVYGPYESNSRLIPALIRSFQNNKKINLVNPKIARDLLHIDDLINFYITISLKDKKKYINGKIYNLGFGKKVTIKNIFSRLKQVSKSNIRPLWGSMKNRAWDQTVWLADMTYVKNKLGWYPKISYHKGLKQTYFWFKKFYESNE